MTTLAWFGTPNDGATCAVTLGSPTVTIAGSNLITGGGSDPGFVGQAFLGPDGSQYEILSVDLATQLTLRSNYRGTTVASAGFFQIVPVQGFSRDAAYRLSQLTTLLNTGATTLQGAKLGLGMVPTNVLDITQTQNASSVISIINANTSTAASVEIDLKNATHQGFITVYGTGFTTSGIAVQDSMRVDSGGCVAGLRVNTGASQAPIIFSVNATEVGRFNLTRAFKATTDGTYLSQDGERHEFTQHFSGDYVLALQNKHASVPFGIQVNYSASAPNGTGNEFAVFVDSVGQKGAVRSNGGLANFSANNVNLSDITVKPEFAVHTPVELDALQASFIAVDWGKFKYADQTHDDWNYGYSAQGVAAAFATAVPAMTTVWNETIEATVEEIIDVVVDTGLVAQNGTPLTITKQTVKTKTQRVPTPVADQLLGVHSEDLHNIAHALLARALTRIATLEARLTAAGIA